MIGKKLYRCAHCDWEGEDPNSHDSQQCARRQVAARQLVSTASEVIAKMMEGRILALDSDMAVLVPSTISLRATTGNRAADLASIPVDRELAFRMVTARTAEGLGLKGVHQSYSGFWWLTRKRFGDRLGWEELGLKPGPSYWCLTQ